MCVIETLGYSKENKMLFCTKCIIYKRTGKCEYLRYLESKVEVHLTKDPACEIYVSDCGL